MWGGKSRKELTRELEELKKKLGGSMINERVIKDLKEDISELQRKVRLLTDSSGLEEIIRIAAAKINTESLRKSVEDIAKQELARMVEEFSNDLLSDKLDELLGDDDLKEKIAGRVADGLKNNISIGDIAKGIVEDIVENDRLDMDDLQSRIGDEIAERLLVSLEAKS